MVTQMMVDAARGLGANGAGCLLICTNTMHKMAAVQAAVDIPLLILAMLSPRQFTTAVLPGHYPSHPLPWNKIFTWDICAMPSDSRRGA